LNKFRSLGLPGLLLAVALFLVACGGSGAGQQGEGNSSEGQQEESQGGDMQGMDHGEMSGIGETTGGMQGMGSGDMTEMSREMVMPNGEYSDAAFVDSMVPHHEGAVEMAEVGLENAEHEEIRQLSRDITESQQAEIETFGQIRDGLDGATTEEMSEEEMNEMMGMMDPQELAQQRPFDRAFIDAMTPHHESAIAMAEVALQESENPEIRRIAEDIVSAQEREIEQMRRWRQEWYPEG
jgi:uncharacterized protein (DUF305 family)